MRQRRRSRPAEIAAGMMSLLALTALTGGLPWALHAIAGSPLPHHLPGWHQALASLTTRDTGALFLAAVRDIAWAAWALFALTVTIEAVCQARGRPAPTMAMAGAGGMQHAARSLVAAVIVAFTTSGTGAPAVMVPAAAVTAAVAADAVAPAAAAAPGAVLDAAHFPAAATVTVQHGDTLWDIARIHLGDPERWREIARANYGRIMPDGVVFTHPGYIVPGFVLHLPTEATPAAGGHQAAPGRHARQSATQPPQQPARHGTAASPAPAGAAAPQEAAPAASIITLRPAATAGHELPAIPVAAAYALGMLSAGIIMTITRMRHRQRQDRPRGRRIALPASTAARRAEQQLQEAAARPLPGLLRGALSTLADSLLSSGQPLPGIAGVHLTPAAAEILLTEPAPAAPGGCQVKPGTHDMCWVIGAATLDGSIPEDGSGRGDLLPGLCTAGLTGDGGYLLLDLEAAGVTTIDGPPDLVARVITCAATELATNPWAGAFDLLMTGFPELEGVGGRAQACASLQEALPILTARAGELTAAGGTAPARARRLADPACPDWTLTLLVSREEPDPDQMARLLELAAPGSGIAVLIAGDITDPAGREAPASIDLRDDPQHPGVIEASLHPLGIVVTSPALSTDTNAALQEILDAAAAPDVAPTTAPYGAVIADWAPAGPPPPGHAAPDLSGLEAASAEDLSVVEDTGPAPPAAPSWPAGPGQAQDPAPAAAAPAEGGPGRPLRVTILGAFTISGTARELKPKHAELVLALALAGQAGLSGSALRTMLGPDEDTPKPPDSLRQIITRTRRELGTAPDGSELIRHAGNSQYILDSSARLDWHEFRALAEKGRDTQDPDALWDALALVRGHPLDGVYFWWVETALLEAVRAEIVDAADLLAELELAGGDPVAARRAARTGLAADPAAEQLWRAVMRAEDAAGNSGGVHKAWQECLTAIAVIAADGEPHQDTATLYSELTRRRAAHVNA